MYTTALIVFRESLEAALLTGVMFAATPIEAEDLLLQVRTPRPAGEE